MERSEVRFFFCCPAGVRAGAFFKKKRKEKLGWGN
jgi:hypothetical protein